MIETMIETMMRETRIGTKMGSEGVTLCAVLLSLCASVAVAHEHWVDADHFYPGAGETVTVHVCSGHYFPKSLFCLKDNVLDGVTARCSDSATVDVKTTEDAKQRTGVIAFRSAGAHMICFRLKRPQARTPSYEGKALLVVGEAKDAPSGYVIGAGLELVPEKPVSRLAPGDDLPLTVRMDGIRIGATLSVCAEAGGTSSYRTTPDRPAAVKLGKSGRYLVTASHKGRGCSLVFDVRE